MRPRSNSYLFGFSEGSEGAGAREVNTFIDTKCSQKTESMISSFSFIRKTTMSHSACPALARHPGGAPCRRGKPLKTLKTAMGAYSKNAAPAPLRRHLRMRLAPLRRHVRIRRRNYHDFIVYELTRPRTTPEAAVFLSLRPRHFHRFRPANALARNSPPCLSPPASMPCPTPDERCHWVGIDAPARSSAAMNIASTGMSGSWSP
jgi:hypothetical protein